MSSTGTGGACTVSATARGLWKVAVAPGGTHAYGIAHESLAIIIFDRDPSTGLMTQRGCIGQSGGDCSGASAIGNPNGIVISPDGANVYVSSGGTITVFDRNPATGALTQKPGVTGCFAADTAANPGCTLATGISSSTLVMTPDGRHLYTGPNVIGIFFRDPSTGALSQPAGAAELHRHARSAARPAAASGTARQMALSPDGRSLYAPSFGLNTLVVLDRDPTTGLLRQKDGPAGCIGATATCTPDPARMTGPHAVSVSPDSAQVYVSTSVGMLVYARAGDGSLALQSCVSDGAVADCVPGRNVKSLSYSAISPDGQTIVAGNETVARARDLPARRRRQPRPARGRRRMHDGHRRRNRRRRLDARAVPRPSRAGRQRPDDVRRRHQPHRRRARRQRRHGHQARLLPAVPEPVAHGHVEPGRRPCPCCARIATATR